MDNSILSRLAASLTGSRSKTLDQRRAELTADAIKDGPRHTFEFNKPDMDIWEATTVPKHFTTDESQYSTMTTGDPEVLRFGATEAPTLDLAHRPFVENQDGSTSTVRSMGTQMDPDGHEVLIPTVSKDGWIMSGDEAVDEYRRTGEHMGKYDTVDASNNAGEGLHLDQMEHEPENTLSERHVQLDPIDVTAGVDYDDPWQSGDEDIDKYTGAY